MPTTDQQNETSMSSSTSSVGNAPPITPLTITLRIHSPSAEVANPLTLTLIPSSTTVRELKLRIRDAVPSKPEIDRQRLIHRGRMLRNDDETMANVFGQAALDNSPTQSLHLVLRPESGTTNSLFTQTQSETTLSGWELHERPASVPPLGQHRPPGLPGAAHLHHHPPQTFNNNDLPHLHPVIPRPVRGFISDHLAAMNQHMAQHLNQPSASPSVQTPNVSGPTRIPPPPLQGGTGTTMGHQARMFQHHIGQHQRARAAAGMHGIHNNSTDGNNQGRTEVLNNHPSDPRAGHQAGTVPNFPGFSSTYTREGQGPNGQTWRVTINESTMTIPLFPNNPERSASPNHPIPSTFRDQINTGPSIFQGHSIPPTDTPSHPPIRNNPEALDTVQHEQLRNQTQPPLSSLMERMEADIRNGIIPSLEPARELRSEVLVHNTAFPTVRLEGEMSARSAEDRRSQSRNTGQDQGPIPNHRENLNTVRQARSSEQLRSTPSSTDRRTNDILRTRERIATTNQPITSVYLVSSPTGPYGLVFSPVGTYTTQSPDPTLPGGLRNAWINSPPGFGQQVNFQLNPEFLAHIRATNPVIAIHRGFPTASGMNPPVQPSQQPQQPQTRPQTQENQPRQNQQQEEHRGGQPRQPQAQAQAQAQAQPEQNNQVRDLLRVILPLGGHLWLLIRLIGFVFFFGGGAGWRRTIIILLGALMIFVTQTGIFAGIREAIMGPVRRHLEGLLPLADGQARPNARGNPIAAVPERAPRRAGASERGRRQQQTGNPTTETTPAAEAAGVIRDRAEDGRQQRGWVTEHIRRVERAILIFVGSLVPGIGERHIAARQQAAAALIAAAAAAEEEPAAAPPTEEQEGGDEEHNTNTQTQPQEQDRTPAENQHEEGVGSGQNNNVTVSSSTTEESSSSTTTSDSNNTG